MYRSFLALRYLVARPISWFSMVGIWLGVAGLVATLSIMSGFLRDTRAMIRGTTADVVVDFEPGAAPASAPAADRALAVVESTPGVASVSPRLVRPAMLRVPDVSSAQLQGNRRFFDLNFVRIVGIDAGREAQTTGFAEWLERGLSADAALDPKDPFRIDLRLVPPRYRNLDLPVLLVGERLAEAFELAPGSVVTLVTLPERVAVDEPAALTQRCVVGGTFLSGHLETDRSQVFVERRRLRRFAESRTLFGEIAVAARPGADLREVRDRVRKGLEEAGFAARVETWEDRHRTFLQAVENERTILGFLLFFFVAVACFNVLATLTIMVSDKTRDIGVLTALGATRRGVADLFLRCGLAMSLSSSVLGALSGTLLAWRIDDVNDLLAALFGVRIFRPDIYTFERIPVEIDLAFVVLVVVATNALSALCSSLPAVRAARLDPVGALRHE